jgi:hypothetical protein
MFHFELQTFLSEMRNEVTIINLFLARCLEGRPTGDPEALLRRKEYGA